MPRPTRSPWLLAAVIFGGLVLWFLSGLPGREAPLLGETAMPAGQAAAPPVVRVEERVAQPVSQTLTLYGRTAPARRVDLKAETTGRVVATGAARGARVGAGDLLVRLDEGNRLARLEQARADLRQRELEYEGQQSLVADGYVSESRLAESAALLQAARAELRERELDLERMEIRAPFAGALQDRLVEVGDYVSPGTTVATFVDDRTLVVAASIAEQHIGGSRQARSGTARLATGQELTARVRYLAPVADDATRTFAVELEFANAAGDLPVGVTAEIDLPLAEVLAHRVSPALLQLGDDGVVGLMTVDPDGIARFVPAQIVRSSPEGVWVTGLGDPVRLITAGQGFVKAGDRVTAGPAPDQARVAGGPDHTP